MQVAKNDGAQIAYESFGVAGGEPLLLIMGLDFSMIWWPDAFCELLADRGFHVVRFDNRDSGLSTRGIPGYTTADMVADGLAVMDAVGWRSAHVIGASLGSTLAMATAILHPERVRSIVGLYTTPWRQIDTLRYLKPAGILGLVRAARRAGPDPTDVTVAIARAMASPREAFDEEWARRTAELDTARGGRDPAGTRRQMASGRGAGDLSRRVGEISVPTLLINGADDPIVRPAAAAALARRIPGARSEVYPAMGHSFPAAVWGRVADGVTVG
ncbi:alpha/beta hydrolase [Winogradskya humida]|uniref:Alpha/beta hydrolase n=1 Tax=Winogradskya humida TaxID=113566 RepID=A0ABQ3ZJ14_9ACTN|nr:alpha/beta hydrolase [Actinoplanes humidus]